jgi:hypothetical protein
MLDIADQKRLALCAGVQDKGDDQSVQKLVSWVELETKKLAIPVKSKNFAENQNEDHAHKDSRLLHVRPHALLKSQHLCQRIRDCLSAGIRDTYRVTNNADSVACRKTSQAYTQTAAQVQETVERTVLHLRRRPHVTGDQDSDHKGIHSNDTRHDDRDEGLHLKSTLCSSVHSFLFIHCAPS